MKNGFVLSVIAAAVIVAAPSVSKAGKPVMLKFGFPAPANSYVNTEGMTPWILEVEKASGGTLRIKLFAGPTLGTFRNIYARTLANVAQIAFSTLGALAGQFPRTQVSGLPFLGGDPRITSGALWRIYAEGVLGPEFKKVKLLALFNFSSSGLHANRPVETIDDLKGMKVAVSSRTTANIMATLGASPVTLTPPELYVGMSRGVIEGIFIGWTAVKTFKLDEVTHDHLEAPLGGAPSAVFMNKAVYAALPKKAKEAINKYSGEAFSEKLGANNEAAGSAESRRVASEPGQSVHSLSASQHKIWEARIRPVIDAWVKRTPNGAKVLAAYRKEIRNFGGDH